MRRAAHDDDDDDDDSDNDDDYDRRDSVADIVWGFERGERVFEALPLPAHVGCRRTKRKRESRAIQRMKRRRQLVVRV